MSYASNIPANDQVEDARTAEAPAAAHMTNEPFHLDHVGAARLKLGKRKLAALTGEEEIHNMSTRRLVHVASVQGQGVYGGGAAPPWAVDLQNSIHRMNARINARINAHMDRMSNQRYNASLSTDTVPLRSSHKIHSGLGPGLPGSGGTVANAPTQAAVVGATCPVHQDYMPSTFNELHGDDYDPFESHCHVVQ